MQALGIAICAIGNRCWGSGAFKHGHIIGALMMGLGLWLEGRYPLWALAAFIALVFLFRVWADGAWLNMLAPTGSWEKSLMRSAWVLPLVCFRFYLDESMWRLLFGLYAPVTITLCYVIAGRQWLVRPDTDSLAEWLAGGVVGIA